MSQTMDSDSFQLLLDELDVAVFLIDSGSGIIHYVNHRVCEDIGKTESDIIGTHYREVFWPEFISAYDRLLLECEDRKEHTVIYYWAEMALWEQISARIVTRNSTPFVLLSITHISEVTRSEYRLENLAYFDNLLKLPNGEKLEQDVSELANIETVSLLYFEIERFQDINNLYGWSSGDSLLKQIRDWLLSSESRRAQLYRVNNGFAILGRKVDMEDAESRSKEILDRFAKPWTVSAGGNNLLVYCTIKLGIVCGKYIKDEMRNILHRTINASLFTKAGYAIYDEEEDRKAKRDLILRDNLINCIYNDMKGFDVHYQPIVDTKTKRWVALEALCRWKTPAGIAVPPVEFIKMAEQLDLIGQIDHWVRKTAMSQYVSLDLDKKNVILNVNFSPVQTIDNEFIDTLFLTFRETGFPKENLNLEVTESEKISLDEKSIKGLKQLKKNGIILSLDDFGTGYSSFANLIKISANALKTEKMFLDDMEKDPYRQYLLRTLVNIAHYLDMRLIAEGVETEEQFALLKKFGVDFIQGYLFSKPLPYHQLEKELWRFSRRSGRYAKSASPSKSTPSTLS